MSFVRAKQTAKKNKQGELGEKDEEKMDSKAQRKGPLAKFWAVNGSI